MYITVTESGERPGWSETRGSLGVNMRPAQCSLMVSARVLGTHWLPPVSGRTLLAVTAMHPELQLQSPMSGGGEAGPQPGASLASAALCPHRPLQDPAMVWRPPQFTADPGWRNYRAWRGASIGIIILQKKYISKIGVLRRHYITRTWWKNLTLSYRIALHILFLSRVCWCKIDPPGVLGSRHELSWRLGLTVDNK